MPRLYYLYVKTHLETGLNYLGQTTQDPFKYRGSGKYWKNHLKIHRYNIDTKIIKICESSDDLKKWGLYYSELWNVVEATDEHGKKIWANEKPESGDGAAFGEYHHNSDKKIYTFYHKSGSIEHCTRIELQHKYDLHRGSLADLIKGVLKTHNGWRMTIESQKWNISRDGKTNPNYNQNSYTFKHSDETVIKCTPNELITTYNLNAGSISGLIRGNGKKVGGWRLISD